MSEQELQEAREALAKAEQDRDRAMLALALRDARDVATEAVGKVDMPAAARTRLVVSISKDPPMKDGALDREAFTAAVEKAATEEKAYIASLMGVGTVRGMGSGSVTTESTKADDEAMEGAFRRMGLSESAAKTAGPSN